jgi:hypothetical protein
MVLLGWTWDDETLCDCTLVLKTDQDAEGETKRRKTHPTVGSVNVL